MSVTRRAHDPNGRASYVVHVREMDRSSFSVLWNRTFEFVQMELKTKLELEMELELGLMNDVIVSIQLMDVDMVMVVDGI